MSVLQAEDIVSGYGELEIVHGASLTVEEGVIKLIVGPNGAGKSTLLKTIMGYNDAWEGSVEFNGEDITGLRPDERVKRGISYVPQDENTFSSLTVRENLEIGAQTAQDDFESNLRQVYDIFPALEERSHTEVGTLSGGQRQMVALGRGLMADPSLLIVDEPTAGIAPDLVEDILGWISEIQEQSEHLSVLMIEQNVQQGLEVADLGYVLVNGEEVYEGDAETLRNNDDLLDSFFGGAYGEDVEKVEHEK